MPRAKKIVAQVNTGHEALPAVPDGLPYGERKQLETSMSAVPATGPGSAIQAPPGAPPGQPTGGAPDQAALMGALQQYQPPQGDLLADSQRPGEPVTAGLASGPGAGPDAVAQGPAPDLIGAQLRAMYQLDPNADILRLIELHDRGT